MAKLGNFLNLNDKLAPDLLLEIELLILAFATGINDATTYADYRVFASNQTGNTVLLAVGALDLVTLGKSLNLPNLAISLGSFLIGGLVLGQLGHRVGRTRRGWVLGTSLVQTLLVGVAAIVRKWVAVSIVSSTRLVVIALLAFASGAQVAMAKSVGVPDLPTAMITSAYVDFVADPRLLAWDNRPRNRRAAFVLSILAGGFVGAAAYKYVGPSFALLLATVCKVGVCVLLCFNRPVVVPVVAGDDATSTAARVCIHDEKKGLRDGNNTTSQPVMKNGR